jgi:suppressor for copper-sensitivity B
MTRLVRSAIWHGNFVAERRYWGALPLLAVIFLGVIFSLVSGMPATAQMSSTVVAPEFWPPLQVEEPGASPWDLAPHSAVRLIARNTAILSQSPQVPLGIEFRMEPGWKTYWRSPGDAGLPAEIDWKGSQNLAGATVQWPLPERETLLGFETLTYHDRVVLPVIASAVDANKPINLRAHINYLVCAELCVPAEATLSLDLVPPSGAPTVLGSLISDFTARVPPQSSAVLSVDRALLTDGHDGLALEVTVHGATPFRAPDIFVEGPRQARFGKPRFDASADRLSGVFTVPVSVSGNRAALSVAEPFTFTLVDTSAGSDGLPLAVEVKKSVDGVVSSTIDGSLAVILLLAFAGGLILNLMPCVLPVLSMKLIAAIAHADRPLKAVRAGFLASAVGIIVSMLILAGIAITAKGAGYAVGWGGQFQQPVFVAAMIVVVSLFAASLLANAEVSLPGNVATLAARGPREGLLGSFLAGAFAALLATPCTAPLLGTAVGFALARGAFEILSVFTVLGLGLAAPYLAVAAVPALAKALPRPGKWMRWVRLLMGLALVATVLWLLSAVYALTGFMPTWAVGIAALVAAIAFARRRAKPIMWLPTAVFALLAVASPLILPARVSAVDVAQGIWKPWDRVEAINRVAAGRTVLVHVTAEWCLNCKVNKALVLDHGAVAERLKQPGTVAMIADWTRADPAVTRFLSGFGRSGIPFDVVYGPKAPAGIVLPEILTQDNVLAALDAAAGKN